jgi:hypothetical protein
MSIDTVKKMMGGPGTTGVGSSTDKFMGNPHKRGRAEKKGAKDVGFFMGGKLKPKKK